MDNKCDYENTIRNCMDLYYRFNVFIRLSDIVLNFEKNMDSTRKDTPKSVFSNTLKYDCDYIYLLNKYEKLAATGDLPLVQPLKTEIAERCESIKHLHPDKVHRCHGTPHTYNYKYSDSKTCRYLGKAIDDFNGMKKEISKYHSFNMLYTECLKNILKEDISKTEHESIALEHDTVKMMNYISVFLCSFTEQAIAHLIGFNEIMVCLENVEIGKTFALEVDPFELLESAASPVSKVNYSGNEIKTGPLYDHVTGYLKQGFDKDMYEKTLAILE